MVFTRAGYPNEWAQVQNNLAIAYMALDRGDRADNQDKAIASLQAALEVFTRDSFSNTWPCPVAGLVVLLRIGGNPG